MPRFKSMFTSYLDCVPIHFERRILPNHKMTMSSRRKSKLCIGDDNSRVALRNFISNIDWTADDDSPRPRKTRRVEPLETRNDVTVGMQIEVLGYEKGRFRRIEDVRPQSTSSGYGGSDADDALLEAAKEVDLLRKWVDEGTETANSEGKQDSDTAVIGCKSDFVRVSEFKEKRREWFPNIDLDIDPFCYYPFETETGQIMKEMHEVAWYGLLAQRREEILTKAEKIGPDTMSWHHIETSRGFSLNGDFDRDQEAYSAARQTWLSHLRIGHENQSKSVLEEVWRKKLT